MTRSLVALAFVGLFASCASTPSTHYSITDGESLSVDARRTPATVEPAAVVVAAEPVATPASPTVSSPAISPREFQPEPPPATATTAVVNTNTYTTIKAGYFGSDIDAADSGFIINAAFGKHLTSLLAAELEIGYFDADGSNGGNSGEQWGVPIMLNGRVSLPLWLLEVYAGLGIGGIYYDAEVNTLFKDDGWLWGGNAFLGANVGLGGLSLGLEGKWYATEDINNTNQSLDAVAVMLTLTFGG